MGTGTSLGVPMLACNCRVCTSEDRRDKRLRSSILVEKGETSLLIDSGPDLRWQLLRAGKSSVDAVFLTHYHRDHTGGLDDLRALIFHKQRAMPVYANKTTVQALARQYEYADFVGNNLSSNFATLALNLQEIQENERIRVGEIEVRAVNVWHGKLAILGFVFDESLVYLTDVKDIDDKVCAGLMDKKILILNALRQNPHPTHLNLKEALILINNLRPQQAYLTHISHLLGLSKEIEANLPQQVSLAYDNLTLSILN